MKTGVRKRTFTVPTTLFFLCVCGFAAGVIEGEEVERKVAKFERYSSFHVSRLEGTRDDLLAFDEVHSDDLVVRNGGREGGKMRDGK